MTSSYFQLRLPENVNEDIQEDPTAMRSLWDRGLLNGASQKVFLQSDFLDLELFFWFAFYNIFRPLYALVSLPSECESD